MSRPARTTSGKVRRRLLVLVVHDGKRIVGEYQYRNGQNPAGFSSDWQEDLDTPRGNGCRSWNVVVSWYRNDNQARVKNFADRVCRHPICHDNGPLDSELRVEY